MAQNRGVKPAIIVLCGTAFSGKTTLARSLESELGAVLVSGDAILDEWGYVHPMFDNEVWARVHDEMLRRCSEVVREGGTAVADDTACARFLREDYRRLAEELGAACVLVVVECPVEEVRRRCALNRQNPTRHDVPDEILEPHLASFDWPADDEHPVRVVPGAPMVQVLNQIRERLT